MRWKGREQSGNVEDRRGMGTGKVVAGGTIGTLAVVLIVWLLGGDPSQVINSIQSAGGGAGTADAAVIEAEKELSEFSAVVLKETEDIWHTIFNENGMTYREPTLVLFSGAVESACGYSGSATGPFYCPGMKRSISTCPSWINCSKH